MTNLTSSTFTSQQTRTKSSVESLAQQWAKKYVQSLEFEPEDEPLPDEPNFSGVFSQQGRKRTVEKLMQSLRAVSAQAWNKTEMLLAKEVKRHRIDPKLINPWEISADSFYIYDKVLEVYTQQGQQQRVSAVRGLAFSSYSLPENALSASTDMVAPSQLSTSVGLDISSIRKKYTIDDPRAIGYVSMQFHYTSQMLLEVLSPIERSLVGAYFKVIDDHLYMPLQRAYNAAAEHDWDSPALVAVQKLLPESNEIAKKITERVIQLYPAYRSHTNLLSSQVVKISSLRDVEMFQVYLWVCALEGNIAAIQQELFPLCVMLYPTLKVKWEIVRQMLHLLGQEIRDRTTPAEAATLLSYFQTLREMFSPEVFA